MIFVSTALQLTNNKNSPLYKGGVAAASADGVVLCLASLRRQHSKSARLRTTPPRKASAPLLCKEGSFLWKQKFLRDSHLPIHIRKSFTCDRTSFLGAGF